MHIKTFSLQFLLINILTILYSTFCIGQLVDRNREQPYQKVFIDTDNFGASYLDSLENGMKNIETDTIRFSILNDLSYYWHTRNLIVALDFTKQGLQLTKAKGNDLWHGRFQITQAAILLRMEKLDSAYIVLEDAKTRVKDEDLAFLSTQLGYIFERKGHLDRATDYALESLKLGEKYNDKKAIALAYSDLSNLFWKHSKFEKGLEYGLRSLVIFEERGINDLDYDFTLYVVGNNYLALKRFEEALKFYEHSLAIGKRYGFYNNLNDVYISLVDLHSNRNDYDKAENAGKNAVHYAEMLDNKFMLMRSWLAIGKLQILQGNYISAITSLKKSISIAGNDFGDNYFLSMAYESLGKAYAGNHSYKEAYTALAQYDLLKDLVFTAETDQRILLLQTEFDVAQKESTIQFQESRIIKQNTRQTYTSFFVAVLLILLLLLYITLQNNRKKSKLLKVKNREKEFLLKEIHHRVKNNLGIVSSLLDLQASQISDPNVVKALQASHDRIYSMSMIHQKLYQGQNLGSIEMKNYFVELGNHILKSFGTKDTISIAYEMKTIDMDVDTAIPLGLIVNELMTNAFKYAFPNNEKGKITIALKKISPDSILLKVMDNGIGLDKVKTEKEAGFGTQLVNLLTKQLDGKLKRKNEDGTTVSILFPLHT